MQKYFQTTWRLWTLLKPFHKYFYLQLASIFIQQLTTVYSIYLTSQILNEIIEKNYKHGYTLAIAIAVLSLVRYFLMYITDQMALKYTEHGVIKFMQEYTLKRILNLNGSQYLEDHSAIKLQVINRGEESVKEILSTIVLTLFPTITQVTLSIIAIFYFSTIIGIITAVTFVLASLSANYFAKYHRPFIKKDLDIWDNIGKIRSESFQHLPLIKNNGVEKEYVDKYSINRQIAVDSAIFTWTKSNLYNKSRFSFFALSKLLITFMVISQAALTKITIGSIYAIWSWVNDAFSNVGNIVNATRRVPLMYAHLEKYLNIIDKQPEFDESGTKKFENGDIVFENVEFKYPKANTPVIKKINIKIPKGKKVAFVGFSGSGKSTIIKLLLRIYDWQSGDIKISGKSLREIDAKVLRQKIGYVEQHVDLFDTSVKENILFGVLDNGGEENVEEDNLLEIVKKARIDQFFDRLGENELDTIIGERGVKLSGGERQRIGIARALIKNPDILIFDEATASLDTENEKYIQEAIDESAKGRTTIIIAHRLSTVQNSDIIFVMEKGEIVGMGRHEVLLKNCKEYQRLIYAQENI